MPILKRNVQNLGNAYIKFYLSSSLTLKCYVENLTKGQGHDLIGKGYVAHQSIRIVGLSTFIIFHRSDLFLSKGIVEKLLVSFYDLK